MENLFTKSLADPNSKINVKNMSSEYMRKSLICRYNQYLDIFKGITIFLPASYSEN